MLKAGQKFGVLVLLKTNFPILTSGGGYIENDDCKYRRLGNHMYYLLVRVTFRENTTKSFQLPVPFLFYRNDFFTTKFLSIKV